MSPQFTTRGWADYVAWQQRDLKTLRRINRLIDDINRNGYSGIGDPEPLVGEFSGWWSRRIDARNRLIYRMLANGNAEIAQCGGHYADR